MIVGIPALGGEALTSECVSYLKRSATEPVRVVVFDNGSKPRYKSSDEYRVRRYNKNRGFYEPLFDLEGMYPDEDIYVLMHNDLFIYGEGWDVRLRETFQQDPKMGIVGFCGSDQIDSSGGRGKGTMCWFNGTRGQGQGAGERITDLRAALILDSLFMAFRKEVIPVFDKETTPAHFYDRIWPAQAIRAGWHCAVLGTEVDHMGGMTLVAEPQYEMDMRRWCQEHAVEYGENAGLAVYLEGERRWMRYKDELGFFPGVIGLDHTYRHG